MKERPLFRPAASADIPTLQSLARVIWHEAYEDIIALDQIAYMLDLMYATDVIAGELASGTVWEIIEHNGKACGFISYGFSENRAVKLSKIYISAEARGTGVSGTALERVIAYARENGRTSVYLTVNKQNRRAIRAYEKNGFSIVSATVFDIGHNFFMDDYVMSRAVPLIQE